MADFPIKVVVDPGNSDSAIGNVDRKLSSVEKTAERLKRLLARVFAFEAIRRTVSLLGRMADAYTNIQNRLKLVTKGTAQLAAVTQQLFKISDDTRTSFESTAEVYARTALSLKSLGISQQRTLAFTKSLNQAIVLSGASAQEASNAMIQLAQGMSSNRLSGEELRSVLEQLPQVADVISKSLGVTRGELRELGAAGKISAEVILKAFEDAREELATKFAKTVPTISQSFVVFRNNLIRVIGELDKATGASASFSRAILLLAQNIDTLTRSVIALGIALSTILVKKGINAAIVGVRTLSVAIAANPIGALATAAIAAVSALTAFSDKIKVSSDGIVNLRDLASATFTVLLSRIQPLIDFIKNGLNKALYESIDILRGFNITFNDVLVGAKLYINTLIGLYVGLGYAVTEVFSQIKELTIDAFGSKTLSAIAKGFTTLLGFIKKVFNSIVSIAATALATVGVSIVKLGKLIDETFELPDLVVPDSVVKFGANVANAFKKGFNQDFVGTAIKNIKPVFTEIEILARDNADKRIAEEKRVLSELEKGMESLGDVTETQHTKISGFTTQINKYFEDTSDLSTKLGKTLVGAFDSAADAFANFVTTGKIDFRSLANSIIQDISRIAIQQALILPILRGLGFGASVATGVQTPAPTPGFSPSGSVDVGLRANGGPVSKGQPYIVGEKRPELFIPSTSGRIEPSVPSSKGSGKTTVVVNNYGSDEATVEESSTADGSEIITVTIAEDLYNRGSSYQAISNIFGITAQGG